MARSYVYAIFTQYQNGTTDLNAEAATSLLDASGALRRMISRVGIGGTVLLYKLDRDQAARVWRQGKAALAGIAPFSGTKIRELSRDMIGKFGIRSELDLRDEVPVNPREAAQELGLL